MIDYDGATDDEINEAVLVISSGGKGIEYYQLAAFSIPDYCNSPANAWPICEEHGISLDAPLRNLSDDWEARKNGYRHSDVKAWRAAMIVYLKMMEAKA